jgi:tetratricopeptide (TPR) repeat protein
MPKIILGYNEKGDFKMSKKIFVMVILVTLIFLYVYTVQGEEKSEGKTKGITIKNREGKDIIYYKSSYALLIGIWDYDYWRKFNEKSFNEEIQQLEMCLKEQKFEVRTVLNPNSQQTKAAIEKFREDYGVDKDNRLLFFFSGHGHSRENNTKGYIVPKDAPIPGNEEREKEFLRKAYSFEKVKSLAKDVESKHFLFVFDCCFSGSIFETRSTPAPQYILESMANPVRQFITAGRAGDPVPEKSVFIPAFVRGIRKGKADTLTDGYITVLELFMYIRQDVARYDIGQSPQYGSIKVGPRWGEAGDYVFINNSIPPPPKTPSLTAGFDPNVIREWSKWQARFEEDFVKMEDMNKDKNLSPESKLGKWLGFYSNYTADNPHSKNDEKLRKTIKKRINHWKRIVDKEDNAAFWTAWKKNTLKSYTRYLDNFLYGRHRGDAFHNRGIIYWKEGKFLQAISCFDDAIKVNPEDAEAHNNRGVCYTHLKKYGNSIKDYAKAIELYKKHAKTVKKRKVKKVNRKLAIVYNNRGVSFYEIEKNKKETDKKKKALEDYKEAVKLNKKYGNAYYNHGCYFLESGDYKNAKQNFKKALKYNKKDAEAWERLAQVYDEEGKTKEAEKARAKAKKLRTEAQKTKSTKKDRQDVLHK